MFDDFAGEKELVRFGTPGFDDQAIVAQWIQDNADIFEYVRGFIQLDVNKGGDTECHVGFKCHAHINADTQLPWKASQYGIGYGYLRYDSLDLTFGRILKRLEQLLWKH